MKNLEDYELPSDIFAKLEIMLEKLDKAIAKKDRKSVLKYKAQVHKLIEKACKHSKTGGSLEFFESPFRQQHIEFKKNLRDNLSKSVTAIYNSWTSPEERQFLLNMFGDPDDFVSFEAEPLEDAEYYNMDKPNSEPNTEPFDDPIPEPIVITTKNIEPLTNTFFANHIVNFMQHGGSPLRNIVVIEGSLEKDIGRRKLVLEEKINIFEQFRSLVSWSQNANRYQYVMKGNQLISQGGSATTTVVLPPRTKALQHLVLKLKPKKQKGYTDHTIFDAFETVFDIVKNDYASHMNDPEYLVSIDQAVTLLEGLTLNNVPMPENNE